jgi:hypothetical protein
MLFSYECFSSMLALNCKLMDCLEFVRNGRRFNRKADFVIFLSGPRPKRKLSNAFELLGCKILMNPITVKVTIDQIMN